VGVAHSDIVNIRNAKLKGFSVERLVRIVNALDRRVELQIRKTARIKAA
jgi:predicted XRE-type DNA-binding protein